MADSDSKTKPTVTKTEAAVDQSSSTEPVFFTTGIPDYMGEAEFLSPWWHSIFTVDGTKYRFAGQYILAAKARLFGDEKAKAKIMDRDLRCEQIAALEPTIKGVDEEEWRQVAFDIAKEANRGKFLYEPECGSWDVMKKLRKLGDREYVYADPADAFLGIGLSTEDARKVAREKWGENVMGKAIDAVRTLAKEMDLWRQPERDPTWAKGYEPFDTSIYDRGGRMDVGW